VCKWQSVLGYAYCAGICQEELRTTLNVILKVAGFHTAVSSGIYVMESGHVNHFTATNLSQTCYCNCLFDVLFCCPGWGKT
jgi:hypothetical protein